MSNFPKKHLRQLLAYCLIVCLLLSLSPMAFAAGSEEDVMYTAEAKLLAQVKELEEQAENSGTEYEGYIVKIKDSAASMITLDVDEDSSLDSLAFTDDAYTADTVDEILDCFAADDIEYIEPNYLVELLDMDTMSVTEPNDQYYQNGNQWNLDVMNVPTAWEYGLEGKSIDSGDSMVIAVIDSGINAAHEDIDESHILNGYSYVTTDTSDTSDSLGHGTFCSGQIMATKDNEVGIAGIAPEVYIMPLRVFGSSNSAYTSDIIDAINYATQSGVVDVISMSLGGEGSSTLMQAACQAAVDAGILVVASAGNDGDYTLNYPAAYDCVIGVGSLGTDTSHTTVSDFSQRGTTNVFCTAPGYQLVSTFYTSAKSYYRGSGTSFAAPEVSALGAILKSIDRNLSQDDFKNILISTCVDLGTTGRDSDYGYGMVDFQAAIETLINTEGEDGTVTIEVVNEDGIRVEGAKIEICADGTSTPIEPQADGSYILPRGRYSYTITADKYQTASGVFSVISAGRVVRITLEGLSYPFRLQPYNTAGALLTDAEITVKNAKGVTMQAESFGSYSLKTGAYTYSISAASYYTQTGAFSVEEGGGSLAVTVYGDIDVASAKIKTVNADGEAVSAVAVTIWNADGGEVTPYTDGYYKLYPGVYTYAAESSNYLTETGSFTITDDQKGKIIELTVEMLNPIVWVYFDVVPIFAQITVCDSTGAEVEPYAPGEYKLIKGEYSYTVTADGYRTVTDSFTITTTGMTVEIEMEDSDESGYVTVTYIANGGTAVDAQSVKIGAKLSAPAEPTRTGYTFAGWYKEPTLTTPWDFDVDMVTGSINLYARWIPTAYHIIYMFGDTVLEGLEPATHTYGVTLKDLPVPVIEGYHFLYWCSDAELTTQATYISAIKASDVVLYACCVEDTGEYTVSFETNGGTAIAPVIADKESGYRISEPENAPAKTGYTFAGWYTDETLTTAWDFDTDTVSWHTTLYAKWTPNLYKITYFSNGVQLTGLTPDSYTYNEAVTSLPVLSGDSVFAGWYRDESFSVRVRSIPVGSLGDITLYAKWTDTATTVPEDCDYEPDEDGNYPTVDAEGYTLIYTQEQLAALGAYCYTSSEAQAMMASGDIPKFRLAQSILLVGEWSPIGVSGYFVGEFDGAGHTIAGLNIQSASSSASLFGKTYGASISNLKLYGTVSGTSAVGSVAGESYYTQFISIESHVDLTASGTSLGGIVARMTGGSVINCANYGSLTCNGTITTGTAIYAVGGILGNAAAFSGGVVTVSGCANYSDIVNNSGTPTGGIVGYLYNSDSAVINCYNRGDVTQTNADSVASCGTAAGIVGWSSGKAAVNNCYSTGTISSARVSSNDYNLIAGIIFYIGNTSSPTSVNVSNCYYLDGTTTGGDVDYKAIGEVYVDGSIQGYVWYYYTYQDDTDSYQSFAYSNEGDYGALLSNLGGAYTADAAMTVNSGYPVLAWQTAGAFTVTFDVFDALTNSAVADYAITLDGSPIENEGVSVEPGLHRFTVERGGYQIESGAFYLGTQDVTVSVGLEPVYYSYTFRVSPSGAVLTLTNDVLGTIAPETTESAGDWTVYTFSLADSGVYGGYSYTVEQYGYETETGTVTVSGAGSTEITLENSTLYGVYFQITPEGAEASVTVTDAKGNVIAPNGETDRNYQLTAGSYSYVIKAEGYYTVSGSFTIPDDNVTTVMISLVTNTGWSGVSDTDWYDANETVYYLSTAEEFAGFRDLCNAGNNFAGKTIMLTADIDLMNRSWTPIGKYSYAGTTDFCGTFDGGGYTITGLNVSGTSRVGLFSSVYQAVIRNVTVEGTVSGTTYIGGIAGYARGSTFENCTSNVDVTTTYYQAGGIVGNTATTACTFIRCVNNGTVTATGTKYTGTNSYSIGGIVGAASNVSNTFEYCQNNGTVSGYVQSVGGIAGYVGTTSGTINPVITNCYNTGSVVCTYSGGYAGGIVGNLYGTYNRATVSNCLNIGEVYSESLTYAGGIAGYKSSANAAITNCWYLSTQTSVGVGGKPDVAGETDPCEEGDYEVVVEALGEAFTMKNEKPALSWQSAVSKYTVTFAVSYDTDDNLSDEYAPVFLVTGTSADGLKEEFPVGGSGTVKLANGTYEYTVSRTGYESVSGRFTVSSETMTVPVTLAASTYVLGILYDPADASVTLKNSVGTEIAPLSSGDGLATFAVTNGTYTYTVSAYGYETATANVGVSFSKITVVEYLTRLSAFDITFDVLSADGDAFTDTPVISLYQNDELVETVSAGETISLTAGSYTYAARSSGYETRIGTFTVEETGTVTITLDLRDPDSTSSDIGWYTDHKGATEFTISNAEELRGLAELVNDGTESFAGKTITLSSDIDLGAGGWTPIGGWGVGHFSGTLDGGGHCVTFQNGEVSGNEFYAGLFGYLDGATVKNLILRGAISITHQSDSADATVVYVGALSGYASGSTILNVSNQMNVTVAAQIGSNGVLDVGGLVGWASGTSFDSCNNIGAVNAAVTTLGVNGSVALSYVGGIVGYGMSGTSIPVVITSCYNTGAISAQAPSYANAAGIIGTLNSYGDTFQMKNCYSAGAITAEGTGSANTAAFCTSASISGVTANNYYLNTLPSAIGIGKTKAELQSESIIPLLGSAYAYAADNYPVLTWERIVASVTVNTMPTKTVYNDMEDFDDTGMTLTVTYTDGSSETVTSGWAVLDGADLRVDKDGPVTTSSAAVSVNISFRGVSTTVPVTVNQIVHEITSDDLALDIPAPVTGGSAAPMTIETDQYTVTVTWTRAGVALTGGEFEPYTFYRANVVATAKYQTGEAWYAFSNSAAFSSNGVLQTLYKQLLSEPANGNQKTKLTAVLTYPATDTSDNAITQTALHLYYEGDDNAAVDYNALLDRAAITLTDGETSRSYTLRQLETLILAGNGVEASYSRYNGSYCTSMKLTGLSLYALCKDSGLFADCLDDSSVVNVGGTNFTWGQIRAVGGSYDAEGNLTRSGLPALLAVAANGIPLSTSAGPLQAALPMQSPTDAPDTVTKVSAITLASPSYLNQYRLVFAVSAADGADISDRLVITVADLYGNVLAAQDDGSYLLNENESYTYKVAAEGYGTLRGQTAAMDGDTTLTLRLDRAWDGNTLTEPELGEDGYYLIFTAEELMWFNAYAKSTSNVRLMADITLNSDGEYTNLWQPMFTSETGTGPFAGIFDGNGHTIKNLYINLENEYDLTVAWDGSPMLMSARTDTLGLFGYLSGTVKDLAVTGRIEVLDRPDSELASWFQLGGIAGFVMRGGTISGCSTDIDLVYTVGTETTVTGGYPDCGFPEFCDTYIGGIAGSLYGGVIENCYSTGSIHAEGTRTIRVGGIVGGLRNANDTVRYCYSTSDITIRPNELYSSGMISAMGSIAGYTEAGGTIEYCFGLSNILDGVTGKYSTANRVIGVGGNIATLSYNYGNQAMSIVNVAETDDMDYSRGSVNGANITLTRARASLQPYTNIGWSASMWKSDSADTLPTFLWQRGGSDVVTYTVAVNAEGADVAFTGGVTDGTTTSASTISLTIAPSECRRVVSVTCTGGNLSGAGGYYTISGITGNVTVTVITEPRYGDVNNDGKVNAIDAMLILRASVGLYTLDDAQREAADVNCDGEINSADARAVLQYSIGLLAALPVTE